MENKRHFLISIGMFDLFPRCATLLFDGAKKSNLPVLCILFVFFEKLPLKAERLDMKVA